MSYKINRLTFTSSVPFKITTALNIISNFTVSRPLFFPTVPNPSRIERVRAAATVPRSSNYFNFHAPPMRIDRALGAIRLKTSRRNVCTRQGETFAD